MDRCLISAQMILQSKYLNIRFRNQNMGCAFSAEDSSKANPNDKRRRRLETIDCRRLSTKVVDIIHEKVTLLSNHLTPQQIQFCIKQLKDHQLFNELSNSELKELCSQMMWMSGHQNQYIFNQGEIGYSFFIIEKGKVGVQVDGQSVAQLNQGQSFGQLALLFRASRTASIKCLQKVTRFFVMKPAIYKAILIQLKNLEYSRNKQIIDKISLFHCLTNKQKYNLANLIKMATFKKNDVIFEQGEISQGIYIVSEGQIEINIPNKSPLIMRKLEMFGQSALKDNGRRQGQAKCIEDATCLVIGKKDIQKSLGSNYKNLIFFNTQKWVLLKSAFFQELSQSQLNRVILGFEIVFKDAGETVSSTQYKGLIISLEGTIDRMPEQHLFNEDQFYEETSPTNKYTKDQAGLISFISFEKLHSIMHAIRQKKKLMLASQKLISAKDLNINLHDFQVVKKLGEGQFGQVFLVINNNAGGGLYAIKCLSKKSIKEEQMELSVIQEKKILQKIVFPFIVGFVKAFHDKNNIYLLIEYLRGKQMFDVIRQMLTLNKPIARYYFGCILISIECLHAHSIIYRDIKPENSVVDYKGKAYLIDLGTAKQLSSSNMFKTFTIIGTPHYMAPEVFEGKGYSFEADYWSLGILLYQFVCGKLPFGQNVEADPYKIYAIIKKGKINYPKYLTDQKVKKLINFILVKDPKARSQQVSFEKIKNHEYFEGFQWQQLLNDKIFPPYIPRQYRSGNSQNLASTGKKFLKNFQGGQKDMGVVSQWNEDIAF